MQGSLVSAKLTLLTQHKHRESEMGVMNLEGQKRNKQNKTKKHDQRFILHHLHRNSHYHIPHGSVGWHSNMPEFLIGIMH